MKTKWIVLTTALLVSMLAAAHDPKEHAKESEAPDCQTFASMDHAKMDMNGPVMQAMRAKCKEAMAEDHSEGHGEYTHVEEDAHAHAVEDDGHDDHD